MMTLLGLAAVCLSPQAGAEPPEHVRGVYLTSPSFTGRKLVETIHFAKEAGFTAVVLHVKDPLGHVHWDAQTPLAVEIGAARSSGRLVAAIARLKEAGLWIIAKQDLFQDTLLAAKKPELAIQNADTGKPWANKNGLCWTNPYDERVWAYNIALAKELRALGVDEIQFDYIRFPSDGNLSQLSYPVTRDNPDRMATIGAFLAAARAALEPVGAAISVDLFGLVAWKKDDFGVGQRIEEIAPHVDAICPMLYPSHFPAGFLGKAKPGDFPEEIMRRSVARLLTRTDTAVRAWVQAFWYTQEEINAQIDGIVAAGSQNWLIWNPASNYERTYVAFEKRLKKEFTPPQFYPTLEQLAAGGIKEVHGVEALVHRTDYETGCTMVRLETPQEGEAARYKYRFPGLLMETFDEAVLDAVLTKRGVAFNEYTSGATKRRAVLALLLDDLGVTANRMSTRPMYVHWKGAARFQWDPPVSTATPPKVKTDE